MVAPTFGGRGTFESDGAKGGDAHGMFQNPATRDMTRAHPKLEARAAVMVAEVPGCDPTVIETFTLDPDATGIPVAMKWGLCCLFGLPLFWIAAVFVCPCATLINSAMREMVEQAQIVITTTHLVYGFRDPEWRPEACCSCHTSPDIIEKVKSIGLRDFRGVRRESVTSCWNKGYKPLHTIEVVTPPGHPAAFAGGSKTAPHYLIRLQFYDEALFERMYAALTPRGQHA